MAERDALLAARLGAGDEDAVAEVFDAYGGLVYGIAHKVTGATSIAEDVAQDVFVALWRFPDRFDPGRGSLRSFLAMQARCRAVDAIRRESSRRNAEDGLRDAGPPADVEVDIVGHEAERQITSGMIDDAIRSLPAEQRAVVELAYFGGRSHQEVAARLGIPLGTAKGRLRLAHEKLRRLLRPVVTEHA